MRVRREWREGGRVREEGKREGGKEGQSKEGER